MFNASAEGASENLGFFSGEQHVTPSFLNSRGGIGPPPLLPADAHGTVDCNNIVWNFNANQVHSAVLQSPDRTRSGSSPPHSDTSQLRYTSPQTRTRIRQCLKMQIDFYMTHFRILNKTFIDARIIIH